MIFVVLQWFESRLWCYSCLFNTEAITSSMRDSNWFCFKQNSANWKWYFSALYCGIFFYQKNEFRLKIEMWSWENFRFRNVKVLVLCYWSILTDPYAYFLGNLDSIYCFFWVLEVESLKNKGIWDILQGRESLKLSSLSEQVWCNALVTEKAMLLFERLELILVSKDVGCLFSLILLLVSAHGRDCNGWRESQKPRWTFCIMVQSVCYPSVQISKFLCLVAQKGWVNQPQVS